jgi:hypothetical protein
MHDVPDEERNALIRDCDDRHIGACYTIDVPRPTGRRAEGPMKVVIRSKPTNEPSAHRLCAGTLTDPIEEDEEDTGRRVWDLIAVMALGVMQYHFHRNPPQYKFLQG